MIIGEMPKNSTEKVRVSIEEYKGYSFIDVRVLYEDDAGEWKPTKKGITVSPEKADNLIELIKSAKEAMMGKGV
jgi:hypothetical protein